MNAGVLSSAPMASAMLRLLRSSLVPFCWFALVPVGLSGCGTPASTDARSEDVASDAALDAAPSDADADVGSGDDVLDATDSPADTALDATRDTGVDVPHVEPAPGMPGGLCSDGGACAVNSECVASRCRSCGAIGQLPCAGATCREGMLLYGICFDPAGMRGHLGYVCLLEDCAVGECVPADGLSFVCFACGAAAGQPCCPVTGCAGAGGLLCTDGTCH